MTRPTGNAQLRGVPWWRRWLTLGWFVECAECHREFGSLFLWRAERALNEHHCEVRRGT